MPSRRPLPVSFDRLAMRIRLWLLLANTAGAAIIFVYLTFIQGSTQGLAASPRDTRTTLIVLVVYMAATLPFGTYTSNRTFEPVVHWLSEDRPATAAEQRIVLSQPLRHTAWVFGYWVGAAFLFGIVLQIWFGNPAMRVVNVFLGVLLGGLATCTFGFLMVERALRPLFAYALQEGPPRRSASLGIRARLVLSWALGSGIPLLGMALLPVGRSANARHHLAAPVVFLAVVGLLSGSAILAVTARSVADPLEEVRDALERVQGGDLSVEITVDDGGEVGLLQSGVNRMVHGLRERQQLQDLFGRHVGEAVALQALDSDVGLGGEQRDVSALFVDVIGSTGLAGSLVPKDLVTVLNAFFDAVVRTVGAEGGWVNKFEGDGALCVFGAPGDQPDHAARALRAARGLRDALVETSGHHPGLDAAIGVSSGSVVAGNVGSEERYEYTVIGDAVNEASRLSELAKTDPGRVLAAERAVLAAGPPESDLWQAARVVTLRGRNEPTCVFLPVSGKGAPD